jgi:hypothetical protein
MMPALGECLSYRDEQGRTVIELRNGSSFLGAYSVGLRRVHFLAGAPSILGEVGP